jgi:D-alanine transfer protein
MKRPSFLSSLPPHLHAVVVALGVMALLLGFLVGGAHWLEHRWIHSLAPETSDVKNQGVILQSAVFAEKDLLPLYGSSELNKQIPDKASLFFAHYPTDFAVSPIGRAGSTSLIMIQKIAAAANAHQGHKLAVILSPSWFLSSAAKRGHYAGNFSVMQASDLIFQNALSGPLKRDIARRLLKYPDTLERSALLDFAVHRLASDRPMDRLLFAAARPLGWLQNAIFDLQDHCRTVTHIWNNRHLNMQPTVHAGKPLPWPELLAEAAREARPSRRGERELESGWAGNEHGFLRVLEKSREWNDLELLLRTLRELHLDPLLVTIPMDVQYFEEAGVTHESVELYYQRLNALADRYRIPVADFVDHENDEKFFSDHHDHLSTKGWMYLDRELDQFFHAAHRRFHPRRSHAMENCERSAG